MKLPNAAFYMEIGDIEDAIGHIEEHDTLFGEAIVQIQDRFFVSAII
ncbi:hypothetical protein [Paenibacillus aestuarii]|nr:hypothetical protein [Paenibacillus aestuarii]